MRGPLPKPETLTATDSTGNPSPAPPANATQNAACPGVGSGEAGRAPACKGCPSAAYCASAQPDPLVPALQEKCAAVSHIIAVMSGKGGVGKSTSATMFAAAAAARGLRTLLLDLDLSGPSIPRMTGTGDVLCCATSKLVPVTVSSHLHVLSAGYLAGLEDGQPVYSSARKNALIKTMLNDCDLSLFDCLIIDTPPNITDEHLALAQIIKPHGAVIITTPQAVAFADARRQVAFCKKAGIRVLGVVENMGRVLCERCCAQLGGDGVTVESSKDGGGVVRAGCAEMCVPYLGVFPMQQAVARAADDGNVLALATSSAFFLKLVDRILKDIKSVVKN